MIGARRAPIVEFQHVGRRAPWLERRLSLPWRWRFRANFFSGRIADGFDPQSRQQDESLTALDAIGGVVENISSLEREAAPGTPDQDDPRERDGSVQKLQAEALARIEGCRVGALAGGQAVLPEPRDSGDDQDQPEGAPTKLHRGSFLIGIEVERLSYGLRVTFSVVPYTHATMTG